MAKRDKVNWKYIEELKKKEEFKALCDVLPTWNSLGARDRAIICLLWFTGIRASELCDLQVEDIDDEEGVIHVRKAKAGAKYTCLLLSCCERNIRRYLLLRPQESDWLFLSRHGEQLTKHGHLHARKRCGHSIRQVKERH